MARSRLIKDAAVEVSSKTDSQIERETALKWMARAIACQDKFKATKRTAWAKRARSYVDEAIEHGALARDGKKTLNEVERGLKKVGLK